MKRNLILWVIPVLALFLSACGTDIEPRTIVPGGDATRGQGALLGYGCESCHAIPGVYGTTARVGPALGGFARRHLIAGQMENTPENAIKWIMNPQAIDPGNAMPNLNVTEDAARDMAAYLYTLR